MTLPFKISRGSILVLTLVISAAIMTVTTSFFGYFGSAIHAERVALAGTQARMLAEAGIDKAIYELNQNSNYSGESDTPLGNGIFSVSVASIDSNTKNITVTSAVPDAVHPTATKTVRVKASINTTQVSFRYGVQVGTGGVTMGNGAQIVGNIFSEGSITGGGTVTGDATVSVSTNPVADQQSTVQNSSFNVGDTSSHADVAQSFKPSVTTTLTKVSLDLAKVGNPSDLTIKIVSDNSGKPSSTVLASGTIASSLVTSAYGFTDVALDTSPTLTADQSYWIIAIASVSASNYFKWGLDTSSGYSRGSAKYSSNWNAQNPSWSSISGDLGFQAFVSGTLTSISGITVQGNAWAYSLSNCTVGGTATYQTISSCSVTGTQYPGSNPATPGSFPISDAQIAEWEATAAAGGTLSGPYSVSGTQVLGPKKIEGNLTVTNGAALILSGPVWVNGNITLSNNASLSISPLTGSSGAILIADATGNQATAGKVQLSNNVTTTGNGSAGSYPMVISTNTSDTAITISNNAAGIILYAPYGGMDVSNGATANQLTAKKLELENNSTITYLSGLQNASFSNGPGGSWAVVRGTYAITQ